jgi:protein gp37
MGDRSKIEWTDASWNPVLGCTKVSPGCDFCYAERVTERFHGPGSFAEIRLMPERLEQPLRWRRPRMVFVNSMSDLFHQEIPDAYIGTVFDIMARAPQHTFQILTKRHARMRSLLTDWATNGIVTDIGYTFGNRPLGAVRMTEPLWTPPPNVWLGVSVENQQWADIRVPALLDTPAAVRFLSCEPLLGYVDLRVWVHLDPAEDGYSRIDWVIAGGESGPHARPMHPLWPRTLRDQCIDAGVPFFFKQRGEWTWNEPGEFRKPIRPYTSRVAVMHGAGMTALTRDNEFDPFERGHPDWATRIERVGRKRAGRMLDGRTWDEYPNRAEETTDA